MPALPLDPVLLPAVIAGTHSRRQNVLQQTAVWIPAGVIGLLMLPLALTHRTFGDDWTKHLWMVRQQELNIQANGRPGLFLSARPLGAFYPIFAFVGSGLYTVGGYLALELGGRPILAYKLLYLGAFCLAYGGMTWLSWLVGLRGWRAQMPGLVFVTGTYFVSDAFARGDLGELAAISAIPLLLASVTAVAISRRLKPPHLLAVAVAVFVLTGSHNITLLYGTIFVALLGLVVLGAYSPSRGARLPWRRLPALLAAAAIGAGLNAWYLLPNLKYGLDTTVAHANRSSPVLTGLANWRLLLDPLRPADASYAASAHDLRVSLPWPFVLWAIVVAILCRRWIDSTGRRLIVLLFALTALYIPPLFWRLVWRSTPSLLDNVQYAWRLHAYVLLASALLMMAVLAWHARSNERERRATSAALAVIALLTVGLATWQAWIVPSTYDANLHEHAAPSNFAAIVVADTSVRPPSWGGVSDFRVLNKPVIDIGFARVMNIPEADVHGSTFSGLLDAPHGPKPFRTNISAGPAFVQITGIQVVGYTASGFVVAQRLPGAPRAAPVEVTIRQADRRLLRYGAVVSMLSLAGLVALAAWALIVWSIAALRAGVRRGATASLRHGEQ